MACLLQHPHQLGQLCLTTFGQHADSHANPAAAGQAGERVHSKAGPLGVGLRGQLQHANDGANNLQGAGKGGGGGQVRQQQARLGQHARWGQVRGRQEGRAARQVGADEG